ncbi:MAG: hypothetical protein A3B30_02525 [Candidatus Komeilibacteria bacterium RIFCSPLOWO2_01_FULL_52_15]|nr:MAG: hypothetical protein A3B30_02525 [Candidatus Komeilibacteria bacterium RIFCSPLOWO2_01_FULL_52_15]
MNWLYIILISYFILSISNLVDKIFLSKIVTESIVYAIWVSLLSVFVVLLLVLDVLFNRATGLTSSSFGDLSFMTPWFVVLAVFIGVLFTLAIYLLYTALQRGEASRIIPLIGGSMPVIIYAMTFWYEPLNASRTISFFLLVAGTVLISVTPGGKHPASMKNGTYIALGASVSFALFFVLSQYLFRSQGFLNGIVWPRLGTAIALIVLFTNEPIRKKMLDSLRHLSFRMRSIWVTSQCLGAVGFVGQQYAISLPNVSVALVSALQSTQYVYILIMATLMTVFRPKLLKEHLSWRVLLMKLVALGSIGAGLFFVSL